MAEAGWQRALIDRLVADARPVRRLWRPEARLLVWLGAGLVVLAIAASGVLRPDVAARLRTPGFLMEEFAMVLGAGLLGLAALRTSVPGQSVGRAVVVTAALALGLTAILLLRQPGHGWTWDAFLEVGLPCLRRAFAWSALPWAVLFWALRRGAPLARGRAGALAGAAALGLTYVALRLCCQTEELVHLAVFHALPVLVATGISAGLGLAFLGTWRGR